jgi:hypothetical protein
MAGSCSEAMVLAAWRPGTLLLPRLSSTQRQCLPPMLIWSTIFGFEAFQSSVCLQSQYLNTRYRALDNFANTSPSCSGHPRTGHDNLPTVHAAKGLLLEVRLRRTVHLAPPPPCHSAFVYHQLSAKKAYSRILLRNVAHCTLGIALLVI